MAAITDGDHEPEVDPYAFEEGDVKFTFSKKDKAGGEREPGKKHKVRSNIALFSISGSSPENTMMDSFILQASYSGLSLRILKH